MPNNSHAGFDIRHSPFDIGVMMPWPVAFLTLFHGAVAAAAAAGLWKIGAGTSHQSAVWPLVWLVVSGGAMCGLPLLKPWGRAFAVIGSLLIILVMLALAGLLVLAQRPLGALLAVSGAAMHVIAIRYLQRPSVKAYFRTSAISNQQSAISGE
jgi:hypothetical protein